MSIESKKSEIYEDELIRLVSSSSDTSTQYVIFRNIEDDLFAINVAKVEELIQNKNLTISKGTDKNSIIKSVAKIRDNMITLVDFDKWLNPDFTSKEDTHELIILCNYSEKRMGIIIKNVVGIQSIESSSMYPGSNKDEKTAYVAELNMAQKTLCNIFNSDRLLMDVFPDIIESSQKSIDNAQDTNVTSKIILVAEDSRLVQVPLGKLLSKSNYKYEMYENGELLLNRLFKMNPSEIGLIIADIEMPIMDGMEMLGHIQNNTTYKDIPIIVHTNMANNAIQKRATELGAIAIAKKLDLTSLNELIEKYSLK